MTENADKLGLPARIAAIVRNIPGSALLFATFFLIVFGYFAWYYYGAEHIDQAFFSLRIDKLTVTAQPDWIKSNVVEAVYESNRLDRVSLLDPRANATIAQAFETHSWVKSATRVTKSSGAKVVVDLIYRRPAAMVYFEKQGADAKPGFFPIDDAGIVLPTQDFAEEDVWKYLMIFAENARPAGDIGMAYGDVRINEALLLCALLERQREPYRLQEIWVSHEEIPTGASPWTMLIATRDKREILWGHAPSLESPGELTAKEKLRRMLSWLELPPSAEPNSRRLDLRTSLPTANISTLNR